MKRADLHETNDPQNWGWKATTVWTTDESWQLNPQYLMLYEGYDKKNQQPKKWTKEIILKQKSP